MAISERERLSVALVDVAEGRESEFVALTGEFEALLARQKYGRGDTFRDQGRPRRFYVLRYWTDAAAAQACHADPDVQALTRKLYQMASVIHVVNGAKSGPAGGLLLTDERRGRAEVDRRTDFDRRRHDVGRPEGERRTGRDRRLGPTRLRDRPGEVDLVAAARRARERAEAAFSHFKVGAALEAADGTVFTGCNVENASYGLTMCAERVAIFKAVSEGHRAFTRIAIVADTEAPTPPCGACRQLLWEFGGNLEVLLANLTRPTGTHRLKDLLPLPFDARLL
ncbi:MAG: cytidine deaminase [Vicinamibacterales bacterium]